MHMLEQYYSEIVISISENEVDFFVSGNKVSVMSN